MTIIPFVHTTRTPIIAARFFALSVNLYYNDYVFGEQKGRMTDMKKAIIVLLTAAAAAGITLTAAGLPVSEAYAAVATPGNMVTEEEGTIKPEDPVNPKPIDPKPINPVPINPKYIPSPQITIDKNPIYVGETATARISIDTGSPEIYVADIFWGRYNEIVDIVFGPPDYSHCEVTGLQQGSAVLSASVGYSFNNAIITDRTVTIDIEVKEAPTTSSVGSRSSSVRSASESSEPASAKVPLAAVTPIVTDSNGTSHFGDAIIAMIPAAYPEQYRTGLIGSGTWTKTAYGYWQLSTPDTGTLRNCWALVSDILSRNPTGSASWYYFDNYGYMVTGWQEIGGKSYYFNEEEGSLYGALLMDGVTPDRSEVDRNGAKIK